MPTNAVGNTSRRSGRRLAVILGGGVAGLLAATAAAGHFESVLIVERDSLPEQPEPRRGTPQAMHVHALLAAGQHHIERLVPGFLATLTDRGAPVIDLAADVAFRTPFGWGLRFPSDLAAIGASRPLVEWAIRTHVLRHPTVTLLAEHSCDGLLGDGQAITGVRLRTDRADTPDPIPADLVVDATGRGSRVDHWLTELGYPPPPTTVINAHVGYATRVYRIPASGLPDWQACYIQTGAPGHPTGAVLMPIEGGRWIVTLIGVGPHRPSRHEEDFLPFARNLHCPAIASAIADAQPLTPVSVSDSTSNRRRYVERAERHPVNLLRIGDAVCGFNPIYAQGMSTAAAAATLLAQVLTASNDTSDLAIRFHRELAAVTDRAWLLATTADTRWPHTQGPSPTWSQRIMARYVDHILATATRQQKVQEAFLDVFNLLRSPQSLLAPPTLIRTALSTLAHPPATHAGTQPVATSHTAPGQP